MKKNDTIRYHDPDMPIELHKFAKMLAAQNSIALKYWIRDAINNFTYDHYLFKASKHFCESIGSKTIRYHDNDMPIELHKRIKNIAKSNRLTIKLTVRLSILKKLKENNIIYFSVYINEIVRYIEIDDVLKKHEKNLI